jgi:signal peptidase I
MTAPRTTARRGPVVLIVVGLLVVIAINITAFAWFQSSFNSYYIPSEAMVPTLKIGDHVVEEELSYRLHDPRRGDIVVFDAPPAAAAPQITELVKRIVGLPGETIEGRNGRIYIDGRRLVEPYLERGVKSRTFGPEQIPDDGYFMLGDNRQYSKDSTFYGPIARDAIVGRMFLRYGSLDRFGIL